MHTVNMESIRILFLLVLFETYLLHLQAEYPHTVSVGQLLFSSLIICWIVNVHNN